MTFEECVEKFTGRDMAYHICYGTTGMEFALFCWNEAKKTEREACAKVVEEFPHWLGETGRREIATAIRERSNFEVSGLAPRKG